AVTPRRRRAYRESAPSPPLPPQARREQAESAVRADQISPERALAASPPKAQRRRVPAAICRSRFVRPGCPLVRRRPRGSLPPRQRNDPYRRRRPDSFHLPGRRGVFFELRRVQGSLAERGSPASNPAASGDVQVGRVL